MANITKLENNCNYKIYMDRLEDSLYLGFYIESINLEYTIIENRLKTVLKHFNGYNKNLHSKKLINELKTMNKLQNSVSKEYISNNLLEVIDNWITQKNKILHNFMNNCFNFEEIKEMAIIGQEIVKVLNNKIVFHK